MSFSKISRLFSFSVFILLNVSFSNDNARRQLKDLYGEVGGTIIDFRFESAGKNAEYLPAIHELICDKIAL